VNILIASLAKVLCVSVCHCFCRWFGE